MNLSQFKQYLEPNTYINWDHPAILKRASALSESCRSDEEIARACFIFVRDEIKHSHDFGCNPVTVKATEVLEHGTGYCYSKSHLLAALLRANWLPAGLCYQRLTINSDSPQLCLHGLNAVYLKKYGWYRMDARGNTSDIVAEFSPPREKLAFSVDGEGECDFTGIWPKPLNIVLEVLENCKTHLEVYDNLPDIEIFDLPSAS